MTTYQVDQGGLRRHRHEYPRPSRSARIDALLAELDHDLGEVVEDVARLSVRLVFQAALEADVIEFLGRNRYAGAGSRNGYSRHQSSRQLAAR